MNSDQQILSWPHAGTKDPATDADGVCFIVADRRVTSEHPKGQQLYYLYESWKMALKDGHPKQRIRIFPGFSEETASSLTNGP